MNGPGNRTPAAAAGRGPSRRLQRARWRMQPHRQAALQARSQCAELWTILARGVRSTHSCPTALQAPA
eukprot:7376504-Prymnesium_polylepis.3